MKRSNVIQSFLSLSVLASVCFSMPACIATKDIGVDTESESADGDDGDGGGDDDSMTASETSAASESQGSSMSGPATAGSDTSAGGETDGSTDGSTGGETLLPETESDSESFGGSDSSGIADTDTTGDPDPVDACVLSGGTWDENSCGHYVCGNAPDCDAVIPGCDCGEGQVFGPGGCEESLECATLPCGELTCAPADELCAVFVAGVKGGGETYACEGLPRACADDPTCDCIEPSLEDWQDCEDAEGGGVIVTSYGA